MVVVFLDTIFSKFRRMRHDYFAIRHKDKGKRGREQQAAIMKKG
jgi:hypothetical protein